VVVLAKRKRLLGEDHLHAPLSMANLAHTYREQAAYRTQRRLRCWYLRRGGDCWAMTILIL